MEVAWYIPVILLTLLSSAKEKKPPLFSNRSITRYKTSWRRLGKKEEEQVASEPGAVCLVHFSSYKKNPGSSQGMKASWVESSHAIPCHMLLLLLLQGFFFFALSFFSPLVSGSKLYLYQTHTSIFSEKRNNRRCQQTHRGGKVSDMQLYRKIDTEAIVVWQ